MPEGASETANRPVIHVWTKEHVIEDVTEMVALQLHHRPSVIFTLSDSSSYSNPKLAKFTGRNFLSMTPLDISPFLCGDTSVGVTYASKSGEVIADKMVNPPKPEPEQGDVGDVAKSGGKDGVTAPSGAVADAKPAPPVATPPNNGSSKYYVPPHSGLMALQLSVTCDRVMLPPELSHKLNPLTIHLHKIKQLPGTS